MGKKQLPKRDGKYLFEVVMRHYERRSTLPTSNRPLEDWGKLISDVPSATAILDRFLHHAEIIRFSGKRYRLRQAGRTENPTEEEAKPVSALTGSEEASESSKPASAPTGSKRKGGSSKPAKAPTGSNKENED
jgi:IstB-like ATP binding protein